MKKILLAAAASTVIASSSAMAAAQGDFYGALYGGVNMLNKINNSSGGKFKSKNVGHLGLGVGYYINDMFRADLTFDHLFDPEFKLNNGTVGNLKFNSKVSADVNALMLNGYADVFDAGMVKFYVGAGVGASRNKAKLNTTFPSDASKNTNAKAKEKTDFAYAAHFGASSEFAPGVNGFLQYSWKDYGKSKDMVVSNSTTKAGKVKFRGHHASLGVRVDF